MSLCARSMQNMLLFGLISLGRVAPGITSSEQVHRTMSKFAIFRLQGTLVADNGIHQTELLSIESLVNEFYHPGTSNARKHTIEGQLQQFQRSPHAWALCLQHLVQFNNQYFWFFNVSTVEVTISQRWVSLDENNRAQIRDSLWTTYAGFSHDIPGMQRDKVAQLIALIGKRQFPEEHPDYMNQVWRNIVRSFSNIIAFL